MTTNHIRTAALALLALLAACVATLCIAEIRQIAVHGATDLRNGANASPASQIAIVLAFAFVAWTAIGAAAIWIVQALRRH